MSTSTQRKTVAITMSTVLLVIGIGTTTYVLAEIGQNKSTPVVLADADAPATQKDSDAVVDAARDKLSAIRKTIEDDKHAHNIKDHAAIVDAGVEYMATHLHDQAVAQFNPLSGFTDITVSTGDAGQTLLLLERTDPAGGLNLTIDPKSGAVSDAEHWGKQN